MIRYQIPFQAIHPLELGALIRELGGKFVVVPMGCGEFVICGSYIVAVLRVSFTWYGDKFPLVETVDELYRDDILWVPAKCSQAMLVEIEEPDDTTSEIPLIYIRERHGHITGRVAVSVDPQHVSYMALSELQKFLLILARHGVRYESNLLRSM